MRVFLDANILFSAAKSNGAIRALIGMLLARGAICVADDYVVTEARRNLERKGPQSLADLDALLPLLEIVSATTQPARANDSLDWLPEKDRPVLASALHRDCDVLLTGDRADFGAGYGRSFGGVVIHSPRSLLELLEPTD